MKGRINALLLIGIIGVSVFASHFALSYGRAVLGDRDMWWTPRSMAMPLPETRDDLHLFLDGEPLRDHLRRGALTARDPQGRSYRVVAEDIAVRLNNWHEVKASFLHAAVYSALLLGASAACLVLGLIQAFRGDRTRDGLAASRRS